jgi:hypothetical protein
MPTPNDDPIDVIDRAAALVPGDPRNERHSTNHPQPHPMEQGQARPPEG